MKLTPHFWAGFRTGYLRGFLVGAVLLGFFAVGKCFALTPEQRNLITGLTQAQADLRDRLTASELQVIAGDKQLADANARNSAALLANTAAIKRMMELQTNIDSATREFALLNDALTKSEQEGAKKSATISAQSKHIGNLKFYIAGSIAALVFGTSLLLTLRYAGLALNTPFGAGIAIGGPVLLAAATFTFVFIRV